MKKVIYNGLEFQIDDNNPFYRYKGGSAKPPPVPDPTPTVVEVDEGVKAKDAERRRQRIQAAGRGGTILTQTNQGTGSATLLGRSSS